MKHDKLINPSTYEDKYVDEIDKYLDSKRDTGINVNLPGIEDFAINWLKVSKKTVYNWAKEHDEFSFGLDKIREAQHQRLVNKGLSNQYNSTITKLMLSSNHGYSERFDATSKGEKINEFTDEQIGRIAERVARRNERDGSSRS